MRDPDAFTCAVWGMAYQLGCRHPSEPTHKTVAATLVVQRNTEAELQAMSFSVKNSAIPSVKARWIARMGRCVGEFGILRLPTSPLQFQKDFPERFATVRKDEGPVPCPIGMKVMQRYRR